MADDEIIKKHTKAVYKVWKTPNMNWKHKLREILLEVFIIVFAVSISIWFHNWSESLKDRKEEKDFFSSLKTDLQADKKEMTDDRNGFIQALQGFYYFSEVGKGLNLNPDSLNKHQWIFFITAQINPRIGRYEALKGSGKLDIIENPELLESITELYEKNFPLIFRRNQSFDLVIDNYITPFIEDHLQIDSNNNGLNWQEVVRMPKMRLMMLQATRIKNNIDAYSEGIEKINQILAEMNKDKK